MMMTSEVTLENISQEVAARQRDYIEFERIQEHQALQNFRSLLTELAPCLYDKELRAISRNLAAGSGEWLAQRTEYVTWANTNNKSHRCLWIHGIPGAGRFDMYEEVRENSFAEFCFRQDFSQRKDNTRNTTGWTEDSVRVHDLPG